MSLAECSYSSICLHPVSKEPLSLNLNPADAVTASTTTQFASPVVAAHSSRHAVRKIQRGPNKVKVSPFDSPWSHPCCKCAHLCCCSRERRPLMYFFFFFFFRWKSPVDEGVEELRKTRRKRASFEMKGGSGEEKRGHTFISLSLRDHRALRQNRRTMAPVFVCAYVCVCTTADKTLRFSPSPLSSHAPLLLLLLSSSPVLFVSRAQRPLPR